MKLKIILGSVREGRLGERVAKWVSEELKKEKIDHEVLDLKDYPMPFVDSATQPFSLDKKYPYTSVQDWSNKIDEASAYIVVTPEYNHGYPAVLKNGFDWLGKEFWSKPVAFISYSDGPIGGARAVEQLRLVVGSFNMYDLRNAISIGKANDVISEDGKCSIEALGDQLLDITKELSKVAKSL